MPHQLEFPDAIGSQGGASTVAGLATREQMRRCQGACGRYQLDGKAMCEACWKRVPAPLEEALFRAWHRWQREPSNPERREQYRLTLDLCIAEAEKTM